MPRLRRLSRRETVLVALTAAVLAAFTYWRLVAPRGLPLVSARPIADASGPPIPRIDLARLDADRAAGDAGQRDLFDYGRPPVPEPTPTPVPVLPVRPTPGPVVTEGAELAPTPQPLPPLNVKYIGSVENANGIKVAVLVTDRQEVLTGQAGQVVANRYRIARIGLESVDLEDVATGQSRRLPLRGS
jgi:hypothetical protein